MRLHRFRATVGAVALLGWVSPLLAAGTTYWKGGASTSWFTSANWTNGVPAPGGNGASFGGGTPPVTASISNSSISNVKLTVAAGSSLQLNNTTTFTADGTVANLVFQNSGTLKNAGTFTSSASSSQMTNGAGAGFTNSGTFSTAGSLTNQASASINNTNSFTTSGMVTNQQYGTLTNTSGTWTNQGTLTNSWILNNHSGATLINSGTLTSNNSTIQSNGLVNDGTLTNQGTLNLSYGLTGAGSLQNSGQINLTGTIAQGSISNQAGGTIALASGQQITLQASTISNAGLISVASGKTFSMSGSSLSNTGTVTDNGSIVGDVHIKSGGIVGGSGSISGTLSVESGGTLSPGNSPGTLTSSAGVMNAGGSYRFEIDDARGSKGTSPGWDLWNVTGNLKISATSSSPFTIDLVSLSPATDKAGKAANFDPRSSYTWTFAQAGSISGFNAQDFHVDPSGFANPAWAPFSVVQNGNTLAVQYTAPVPEPGTLVLSGMGMVLLLAGRTLRRRAPTGKVC